MEVERIHFKEIASTHTFAKEHAGEFNPKKLTCITADVQTAGRGRYPNRSWVSKKGNLHMTLFLLIDPAPYLAALLAFSAAEIAGSAVGIKWPNDLLYEGKKFCGTMAETTPHGVVLSIGMDVNAEVETDQPTTSLKAITSKEWDLKQLAIAIVAQFLHNLNLGFASICDRFSERLLYQNQSVVCTTGEKKIEGILLGITEEGFLQLKTADGEIKIIPSGEIASSYRE